MKKYLTLSNLFLLAIFCLPLYMVKVDILGIPTNISELLAVSCIVIFYAYNKFNRLKQLREIPFFFILSCIFMLAGLFFSTFSNNNILTGLGIIKGWFLIPMIFSFSLYCLLKNNLPAKKIMLALFYSGSLVGATAFIYKLMGVVTYDNRLTGFYISPNYLAMYLSPAIIFGFYFIIIELSIEKYSKKFFLYLFFEILMLTSLYWTLSYGAWLALALAIISTSLITNHPKQRLLPILGITLLFLGLVVSQIGTQKFSNLKNFSQRSSTESRIIIWKASILMLHTDPWIGIGPGNFQNKYLSLQPYFSPYLEWAVPEPHNIFLAFWLQAGLLGLMGFLGTIFLIFYYLFPILKNKGIPTAIPLFTFFLYTTLHGIIDTTFWKNDLAYLFWICIALLFYFYDANKKSSLAK